MNYLSFVVILIFLLTGCSNPVTSQQEASKTKNYQAGNACFALSSSEARSILAAAEEGNTEAARDAAFMNEQCFYVDRIISPQDLKAAHRNRAYYITLANRNANGQLSPSLLQYITTWPEDFLGNRSDSRTRQIIIQGCRTMFQTVEERKTGAPDLNDPPKNRYDNELLESIEGYDVHALGNMLNNVSTSNNDERLALVRSQCGKIFTIYSHKINQSK